ncbi:MAG: hypothetical protein VX712_06230 [Bacteroidota bacterium]|nr:hypothetical protein [Bacteroidota bacterium]
MERWFKVLVPVVLLVNLLAIYMFGEPAGRWFRFGSMLLFFLIYVFRYFSNPHLFAIFFLFLVCDYMLINYENDSYKLLTFVTRLFAYVLIILLIWPSLRKLKVNLFTGTVAGFALLLNIYLISLMGKSTPENARADYFYPIFYAFGISLLALVAVAISYHNRYGTPASFYLVVSSFGLILSDVFFYIAFYLGFDVFYYLDRVANILAISFLVAFAGARKEIQLE